MTSKNHFEDIQDSVLSAEASPAKIENWRCPICRARISLAACHEHHARQERVRFLTRKDTFLGTDASPISKPPNEESHLSGSTARSESFRKGVSSSRESTKPPRLFPCVSVSTVGI